MANWVAVWVLRAKAPRPTPLRMAVEGGRAGVRACGRAGEWFTGGFFGKRGGRARGCCYPGAAVPEVQDDASSDSSASECETLHCHSTPLNSLHLPQILTLALCLKGLCSVVISCAW